MIPMAMQAQNQTICDFETADSYKKVSVSETRQAGANRNYAATNMTDGNKNTYWATNDGTTQATITLTWDDVKTVRYVSLMEYIRLGQRVKSFTIETSEDGKNFKEVYSKSTPVDRDIQLGFRNFAWKGKASTRYIRVQGSTTEDGGWLFTDEIVVK